MKSFLSSLILLFVLQAQAEIIDVSDLGQVQKDFAEKYSKDYYPQNMLVVLGMDNAIFKPLTANVDNIDNDATSKAKLANIWKQLQNNSVYMNDIMLINYDHELSDAHISDFIKGLKDQGTPVILTTNGLTGNLNNIPKLEVWRADYLKKKFNIDLETSFPKNNWMIFNNLQSFENTYPVFYKGILSSNNTSEAGLILNFLMQVKFIPQIFIMIDSSIDVLTSTEMTLKTYSKDLTFIGYHYTVSSVELNINNTLKLLQEVATKVTQVKRNNPSLKTSAQPKKSPYDAKK